MPLLRPFEPEEVKAALFAMGPDESPKLDGMNSSFFQQFSDVLGGDVTNFVLHCLNKVSFPNNLNDANIVLISKKSGP